MMAFNSVETSGKKENRFVNGPVGVSASDLEIIRSKNDKDSIERYYQNVVRVANFDSNEENLPPEISTALFLKRRHLEKIKNYFTLGLSAIQFSAGSMGKKVGSVVDTVGKKIYENSSHISKIAIKYINLFL